MKRTDPRHGTPAGYAQHRRDDESACIPCRKAASEAAARRKEYDAALKGGRWVLDTTRRIQRWERAW